jgi:glycosyltransferase involved in cell wall biosynthesis
VTPRRLLSIAHSYVVGLNRRLPRAIARESKGRWEVTTLAPRAFMGDMGPLDLAVAPEDGRVLPATVRLSRSPHFFWYGRELREALRERWDLVHAWEEPYVHAGYQVARAVAPGTPLVVFTNQNLDKRYPWPFSSFETRVMERAQGWIASGQLIAKVLGKRPGYASRPLTIIPFGVDGEVFRPDPERGKAVRARLGWTDSPPVVGYLGRFVPEKGVRVLTEALDRVTSPWRALFVGGGPLEHELREWGARHGDRVRVVTGVGHEGVPDHLNAMDLLCGPSQTTRRWREQFGRMVIEAFACAVPVIGSDSGEIPFVVGDSGLVVPEADVAAWSQAIATLVDSPERRAALGKAGLERARTDYSWDRIARAHVEFFESLTP